MKIYIEEKSKAEINRRLEKGDIIEGVEYNAFNPLGYITNHILNECNSGTTVAIFDKMSQGNPIAKSWGTWNKEKGILK